MVTTVGNEVIVNAETANTQMRESITRLSNGNYVVSWCDWQDGSLKFRMLSAGGVPLGSVDTSVTGALNDLNLTSTIVGLADGSFVITWAQNAGTGNNFSELLARRYSATGVALSEVVTLNAVSAGYQNLSSIAATSDGGFAVTYSHFDDNGGGPGESTDFLRFFSSAMVGGSAIAAGQYIQADIYANGKAPLTNSPDFHFSFPDGTNWTIEKINYATNGTYSSQNFSTNITFQPSRSNLKLWSISSDTLLSTWAEVDVSVSPWTNVAKAQLLRLTNGSYQALGDVFIINAPGDADFELSVAAGPDRKFVVSWSDEDFNVHAQQFQAEAPTALPTIVFDTASVALKEGEQRSIAVKLSTAATQDITFTYAFVDGTALYGADLKSDAKVKQVTIQAGSNVAYIPLLASQDLLSETTENLKVRLISATGATLGATTEATVNIVNRPLNTTASLFETNGKLVMMATLAEAAYVWGAQEEDQPILTPQRQVALSQAWQWLSPLNAWDLPDLKLTYTSAIHWNNNGLETGMYHNRNGAALLGRTSDALFVAFRGTNDGVDVDDWANRHAHFNLFGDMLTELIDYVIASRASGAPISRVYLTGHSLGAGMVAPALDRFQKALDLALGKDTVIVEGVTFANPGSKFGADTTSDRIANFWNGADIIKIASAVSWVEGDQYHLNNALYDFLGNGITPIEAHSAELYRAAMAFLFNEGKAHGVRLDLAALDGGLRGYQIERISYGFSKSANADSFAMGQGSDFIFAGALEMIEGVATTVAVELRNEAIGLWGLAEDSYQAFDSISNLLKGANPGDFANLGAAILNLLGEIPILETLLKSPLLLLKVGLALIEAVENLYATDLIVGGAGNDFLFGLGGHDVILGGADNDLLWGGPGNDLLYGGTGRDYLIAGSGDDRLLGGAGDDFYVVSESGQSVEEAVGEGVDTVISYASYDLSYNLQQNVENLVLAGFGGYAATGNDLGNRIVGNGAGNRIEGRGGADLIYGGGGYDSLYGGAGIDSLLGDAGNDTLDGGSEADQMLGGKGNDTFYVDNISDRVRENTGEGYDTVITTYGYILESVAEIEVMQMWNTAGVTSATLKGNGYAQSITGNAGANIIDGLGGGDRMTGLGGNDTYYVDTTADYVYEAANAGYDIVYASANYTLRNGVVVEKLAAVNEASTTALTLVGNEFSQEIRGTAGADILYGMSGKDSIYGGGGRDSLYGGFDDDSYYIKDATTVIVEKYDEGTADQVFTKVSYTLGANAYVEILRTEGETGTAKIDLTGNDFANQLIGNDGINVLSGGKGNDTLFGYGANDLLLGGAGNDWLLGGKGNDTLFGGADVDYFCFDAAVNAASNVDYFADFDPNQDYICLKIDFFSAFSAKGVLSADAFYSGAAAHEASDRIIYDAPSGVLYYDPDGTGAIGAQQFAKINSNLALTYADIYIT